ncbi:MAG: SUMF1/EgtB/PvdO family nonheme iron enzyme [Chitinivibrionales bacterium]|nr:SUMF1/EgtB/PvdO family nonheme iron enzyme [Chitinivibrionales bacterium]
MSIFLTILTAIVFLVCSIILIITVIGQIKIGSFNVDLCDLEQKTRMIIGLVSFVLCLAALFSLIYLITKKLPPEEDLQATSSTPAVGETTTSTKVPSTSTLTPTDVSTVPATTPTVTSTATVTSTPTEMAPAGPTPTLLPIEKVFVPEGTYLMGSDYNEARPFYPAHDAYTDRFYIYKYEVTNAQYAQCVEARVCSPPTQFSSNTRENYFNNLEEYGNYPVIYVTWEDAKTFCEWRGDRLPTEAEWEKAAKWHPSSGITTRFPWGESFPEPAQANFRGEDTTEVGQFPQGESFIGVHDMAGNVFEWVSDSYDNAYYTYSPEINPTGPKIQEGDRVLRGGSWRNQYNSDLFTFWRFHEDPDTAADNIGFRCVSDTP